mmetsp:Transcript_17609/g.43977  ORF Transcript_17609/g.43977 Transcript_17609/m.43977 type:complete len:355 (+) Transcript_17609:316-1380(+)|eukprot:CAMPEP_0178994138 /NCGR_PEP_ID=MMETSP0795-20121207/7107_1 /TAXON_ID=88552 /ORGANISM="Amoebophrya sp., Strain Ameob2" /LENGTH=354 /DNA_ID=CAMNT_0020686305 /DNA_START=296 /DNA_END=1360 /DNA_ORIENTATION=-
MCKPGDVITSKPQDAAQPEDATQPKSLELYEKAVGHERKRWREKPADEFTWSEDVEPHVKRRKAILEKHPEILKLYKPDPMSAVFCVGTCLVQLSMAYLLSDAPWWLIFVCAYVVSGTMNHSLVLAMHELSHDLWFKNKTANTVFAWFINCPTCVASASTFKRYHLEHHTYQGSKVMDADLPTALEGKLFRYTPTKVLWVALQPFFYGLRPLLVKPKPVTTYELLNWVVVGSFDLFIMTSPYFGQKSFAYLLLGSVLGLGLHPMAGHFIAEHFEFIEGQETYSYYGPLNFFAYNVGYHNEHHDFPRVPGRLLPKVREMAPEFYDNLPYYDSWTAVLLGFIFGRNINCFCRVTRK